jgi:two-component system NtrC family sensor kinase
MNEPARGRSVRFRLLAIALLPMLVILPLLLGVAISRWNSRFDATLISKVHGDLTIAHQWPAFWKKPAFRSARSVSPPAFAM